MSKETKLITYPGPSGLAENHDFTVRARPAGGEWEQLFVYDVKVDMHQVRHASMAMFDCSGTTEIEVTKNERTVNDCVIRPLSRGVSYTLNGNTITFTIDGPQKLSVEVNGDRFHNLHLFANPLEQDAPSPDEPGVAFVKPGIHRTEDLLALLTAAGTDGCETHTLYFGPGMHHLEEVILRIPSRKTVYIAGGAAVAGSMVCDSVSDVTVRGRGVLYLTEFGRFSAFRGVRIIFSKRIRVEGIALIDPPHYSIYIGKSEQIRIANFKAFSTKGWSDGIDMMASSDIEIEDVFMRNSDDCIAVYASRWDYQGDTRNVVVRNSVLWADVAHPMNIGGHGNHHKGDVIENIMFENIDVLEHHEPQPDYRGCMSINAGDNNTVRNVTYRNIRVEPFELGQLFDIRVLFNPKYNPVPGKRIEHIHYENISCSGDCSNPSRIGGYDADRTVEHIVFKNVTINGKPVTDAESGNIRVLPFAGNIRFE
ncbi:glycosyl hydrolase family 28 protein [Paenibacillus sp. V4I5]|uniref:glycosyl hydrolase family 28 protein n=1 Tax=Paenibacillus sp. V4I5 TaxID=3042306 RepID=UPI00278CEF8B|nr:glycosyl hydrolase family 28 protein [Paenibacillus sp. V4I5]MDQ0919458.1 hypothetical protein [Paenibacillus sp. V4I5]